MADPYISRKEVNTSYRPNSNLMSPGLQRAREPFRIRNAITGLLLAGFAAGVWAYSISAVKQDDFSDIDEEAKALARTNPPAGADALGGVTETATVVAAKGTVAAVESTGGEATKAGLTAVQNVPSVSERGRRGVLAKLLEGRPWGARISDPTSGALVWGAPSVDNIGKLSDRELGTRK